MNFQRMRLQDFASAHHSLSPEQEMLDAFSLSLRNYLAKIADSKVSKESQEEFEKNLLRDFLKENFEYDCNTKGKIDLAIYDDSSPKVIFEVKSSSNAQEFVKDSTSLESKAFYESILYFLRENIINGNNNITHIILSNAKDFYLIDANEYLVFAKDKMILKAFKNCQNKEGNDPSTAKFYDEIAKILPRLDATLHYTHFRFDKTLLESTSSLPLLYQILSPQVLLKRKNYLDANTLNQNFYNELLHILGLEETTQHSKVMLQPSLTSNTLLDSLCAAFELDRDKDFEEIFSLLMTWNNRILFLRLLESMLLSFEHIEKPFLDLASLPNFQMLNTLFFDVLAKLEDKRDAGIPQALSNIPYLNSSLFDKTSLEIDGKEIKLLDSKPLKLYADSILYKDKNFCTHLKLNAQTKDSTLPLLEYFFAFLHAYNFTTTAKDIQNYTKTNYDKLINSAVLGLVFEKLNGYKEGSFYTPSFITRYMCKQSLEKVVLQKFNECKNWDCQNLEELKTRLDKLTDSKEGYKEANIIFDSIKLCDPAVGSGHFLVSALNEMIALKFELRILCDENNERLKDIDLKVINDEIVIRDSKGTLFSYTLPAHENIEAHKIQKALFSAKRKLIESCLFGVDINPNSCEITKLRLWIELLKYSYYKDIPNKRLETLPNIDINIKCGNSLISRFATDSKISKLLEKQIEVYKKYVKWYKEPQEYAIEIGIEMTNFKNQGKDFKNAKEMLEYKLKDINRSFTYNLKDSKTQESLTKKISEHFRHFGYFPKEKHDWDEILLGLIGTQRPLGIEQSKGDKAFKSFGDIQTLKAKLDYNESGEAYKNAFEWRFAFPEVLDSNGDFLGFDLVIGNPPYMQVPKGIYNKNFYPYSEGKDRGKQNLYKVFIELGYNLGHRNSIISFITQSSIMCDISAQFTRELLLKNTQMHYFVEFKKNQKIFTNVIQGVCMVEFKKAKPDKTHSFQIAINNAESQMDKITFEGITQQQILEFFPLYEIPLIKKGEMPIIAKVKHNKIYLKDLLDFSLQGNINTIHLSKIQSAKPTDILIYKGAHCHRYYLDKEPFYGLNNKLTNKIIAKNQNQYIITTQNITGTADKIRIYANFVESKNTKIVFLDSCNISYCKNLRDAKFLVGILNSYLLNWLFKITSTNNHVNLYELESLPIPKITKQNQKIADKIITLVDEILKLKAKDSTTNTSNLESEIDSLVYQLYNLTDEEIAIVEGK